jgi:hypothetical protein
MVTLEYLVLLRKINKMKISRACHNSQCEVGISFIVMGSVLPHDQLVDMSCSCQFLNVLKRVPFDRCQGE